MSGIKLKVTPQFPSQVIGQTGVTVSKSNGNYYINIDYSQIPQSANSPPNPNLYVLAYDIIAKQFWLVPK